MYTLYILRAQSSRPWPNEHGMESMFSVIARSEKLCIRVFFGSTDLENLSFIPFVTINFHVSSLLARSHAMKLFNSVHCQSVTD